jgi:hypothetical protein
VITAGLPMAGQRITLRLGGPVAHILSGTLARTVACPVPVQARARLRGARAAAAGRGYLNLCWSSGGYRSAARS